MAADGTTFPPFKTIPELKPVASLSFTAQVWINQDGQDWRCNIGDIAALMPPHVTSFNGRTGDITLGIADITAAGGAPNSSPVLVGVPQAPTPPTGADDTRIATTAFVHDALSANVVGVSSFNGRAGEVELLTADITGAGGATAAQLANYLPLTGGVLAGPGNLTVNGALAAAGGLTSSSAVLSGDLSIGAAKSAHFVWAGPASGVAAAPAWRQLSAADITGLPVGTVTSVGLTVPGDMTVGGSPVTGAGTINVTRNSQAANLVLASPNGVPGVPSYRALQQADIAGGVGVTSVGLQMPALFGVAGSPVTGSGNITVTVPNQGQNAVWAGPASGGSGPPTFRALTVADMPAGLPSGTVTSVGLALPSMFAVTGSPVTGAGTLTGALASQAANLVLASPNGASGAPTFRALTQADISGGVGVTSVGLTAPTMFTVSGSPVTTTGNLGLALAAQANNTVLAGPTTGGPLAPTFRQLQQSDIAGGVGVTSLGLTMPADFSVANSPVTGAGTLIVTRASQAAGLFLASPAGAAGVPSYRGIATTDLPSLSGLYLPLTGGALAGPGNLTVGGTLGVTGNTSLNGTLGVTGATTLAGLTVSGGATANTLTVSGGGGPGGALVLDGPAATVRQFNMDSAGVLRWRMGLSSTAESGGNAGSDFFINSYTDAGGILASVLGITRATSAATFSGPLTAPNLTVNGAALPTSNGIYLPAANVLGFAQNGIGRWFIASTNGLLHNSTNATLSMNRGILNAGAVGLTSCFQAGYSADGTTGNAVAIYGNATNGGVSQISTNYTTTDGPLQIGTFSAQNALSIATSGVVSLSQVPAFPVQGQGLVFASLRNGSGTGTPAFRTIDPGDFAANAPQNQVLAGPTSGTGAPAYRLLVGADLPVPSATTLGGVFSVANTPNNWVRNIATNGTPVLSQPATTNLSDATVRAAWTPVATFATPGDLTVAYTIQTAWYAKVGNLVFFACTIAFTPTYTTASGNFQITGLPVAAVFGSNLSLVFPLMAGTSFTWPGGTAATQLNARITGSPGTIFDFLGSRTGQAIANITTANLPTGVAVTLHFTGVYST